MKRPAFQFYPKDWRNDAALQSCSIGARGLWLECMNLMHECDPYGHLVVNGAPMGASKIARLCGVTPRDYAKLLGELVDAGVPSFTEDGVMYSRRMVRDEQLRNVRAEGGKEGSQHGIKGAAHGSKGGRPRNETGVEKPPLKRPPSSSSSSASAASTEDHHRDDDISIPREGDRAQPVLDRICEIFEVRLQDDPARITWKNQVEAMLSDGLTEAEIIKATEVARANGKKNLSYVRAVAMNPKGQSNGQTHHGGARPSAYDNVLAGMADAAGLRYDGPVFRNGAEGEGADRKPRGGDGARALAGPVVDAEARDASGDGRASRKAGAALLDTEHDP